MNKIIRYTLTGLAALAVLAVAALAVFAARGGFQPQESVQDTPTGSVPPGAPVAGFPAPGPGYPAWQRQNRPGPPGVPGGPAELVGEVVSLNQDNLTLFAGNGQEFMVRISEVTTVRILEGDQVGKAGDIQIGDQVRVQGLPKGPDLFEARSLVILPRGDHLAGRVRDVKGGVITLATPQGELAVLVSAATKIQSAPGQGGPLSLSSIEEGMHVTAVGELQEDGRLVARFLILRRPESPGVIGPGPSSTPGP